MSDGLNLSKWTEVDNRVFKELPYHVAEWVAEFGSLTEKLARNVEQVKIDLLLQQESPISQEEGQFLETNNNDLMTREVILYGPEKPWIYARTLLNQNAEHLITELGNKPLGSILFSGTQLRRHRLELKKIEIEDKLYQRLKMACPAEDKPLWARRSLWLGGSSDKAIKILVSEVFLPDSPVYP